MRTLEIHPFELCIRKVLEDRARFLVLPKEQKLQDYAYSEWSRMFWLAHKHRKDSVVVDADGQRWLTVFTTCKRRIRIDDRTDPQSKCAWLSPRQLVTMQTNHSVFRLSDYNVKQSKSARLLIDAVIVKRVISEAKKLFQQQNRLKARSETLNNSNFHMVNSMLERNERTGRISNQFQGLCKTDKDALTPRWWDYDMSKANLRVVSNDLGVSKAPLLNFLYDNAQVEYPRLADEAGCDVSLVKLFVNLVLVGRIPVPHDTDGWIREARCIGMTKGEASQSLKVLKRELLGHLEEARAFWNKCGGSNQRTRTKIVSTFLMRKVSDFILYVQILVEALGTATINIHDGFYAEQQVPGWVFTDAELATGLSNVVVTARQVPVD